MAIIKNPTTTIVSGGGNTSSFISAIDGLGGNIVIPEGTTTIRQHAFYFYQGEFEITIPSTVTSLGDSCIYGCRKLKKIKLLPTTPPTYGPYALYGSSASLQVIEVPAASLTAYQTASGWSGWSSYMVGV